MPKLGRRLSTLAAVGTSHRLRAVFALVVVVLPPLTFVGQWQAEAASSGLRVSSNQLLLDGAPFEPRGFTLIGVLDPACTGQPDDTNANAHFTPTELSTLAGAAWVANTVRFQVSQFVLSDPNPATVSAYLGQVQDAVTKAHTVGLSVILSMDDQPLSCDPVSHDLPSAATVGAWANLAPVFAGDSDVMFELYNEPVDGPPPGPGQTLPGAEWTQWLTGVGTDTNEGALPIGMQDLVNDIRAAGASNVLIADGLNKAGTFAGMPASNLTDGSLPTPNIAYAVHPYYDTDPQSSWDARFGNLSATDPVVATEWNFTTSTTGSNAGCGTAKQTVAPEFLTYLADRGIGVLGYAGDAPLGAFETRAIMADWNWNPTTCPAPPGGPGVDFQNYLTSTASPRASAISLSSITPSPFTVFDHVVVTGTLSIDGQPGVAGIPVTVRRTDATGIHVLPTVFLNSALCGQRRHSGCDQPA